MPRARISSAALVVATAAAVLVCVSTANAAAPIPRGGDPRDPEGPVPVELVPTPELTALRAVGDWIAKNPSPNAGGAKIADDRKSVIVSWKGTVPPGLNALAASQPVPVTFRVAAYSSDELAAVAKSLVTDNPGVVTSAAESPDYSGVVVWLSSKAPPTALANLKARSTVPIFREPGHPLGL